MAKENEQLLKHVKPQEANSLVQSPRREDPASGNRLPECLQNFKTLEENIQFTTGCEDASSSGKESLLECATRPPQT